MITMALEVLIKKLKGEFFLLGDIKLYFNFFYILLFFTLRISSFLIIKFFQLIHVH